MITIRHHFNFRKEALNFSLHGPEPHGNISRYFPNCVDKAGRYGAEIKINRGLL